MGDFLALFYLVTAAVWLYRSKRAFDALREIPEIPIHSSAAASSSFPKVSILLPVKNEETNLKPCLQGLLRQDYPAKEIIVINDHSIDRTAEILSELVRSCPGQIKTMQAETMPPGWTGKNWALAQGVKVAEGEWFLFTDADTRHESWALASAITHAEGRDLDLLTLTPRCLVEGFWEKLIQPAAMTFLGLWFPLNRVNDPTTNLTFGNGQFLLIKKKAYETMGGHAQVKDAFLEDYALVETAKKKHLRIECAFGSKIYGTRMYQSFLGIWLGWRRIYYHAFRKNPVRLFMKSLSVFVFSFLPFFFFPVFTQIALHNPEHFGKIWGAGFPILAMILLTAWKAHDLVKAPRAYAFLHPVAGFILTGILGDAFWTAVQKKELKWR